MNRLGVINLNRSRVNNDILAFLLRDGKDSGCTDSLEGDGGA